jgi:acyl carrier protein
MSEQADLLPSVSVLGVVQRLLAERSLAVSISADDDLRAVGLTSLDMVNLVLSVEAELDLQIPESAITPANFRSVSAIDALVSSLRG